MIRGLAKGQTVRLSRVGFPVLREALASRHEIVEVPAVRGVTVWAHGDPTLPTIVEVPNRLGRQEAIPEGALVVGHTRREDDAEPAALLRKHLLQIRGVVAPWDQVEAPWFTLLLPVDPAPVADMAGWAHPVALPEFPGGIVVEVPRDASRDRLRQYAAAFEKAVTVTLERG